MASKPKPTQLNVTRGANMRQTREEGVVLPFPSGNNYRVRNVGAAKLLRRANLPNPLLSFALDAFYHGMTSAKMDNFLSAQDKRENAVDLMDAFRVVCEEMFVEPRIVERPQADDEVMIDDIPIVDQLWAFKMQFQSVEEVFPFRAEQDTDVERVPEPQDVPQATE